MNRGRDQCGVKMFETNSKRIEGGKELILILNDGFEIAQRRFDPNDSSGVLFIPTVYRHTFAWVIR